MITQYEFSLIHRFLMQNSMISHYFGIFEAMYHWEENDSALKTLSEGKLEGIGGIGRTQLMPWWYNKFI